MVSAKDTASDTGQQETASATGRVRQLWGIFLGLMVSHPPAGHAAAGESAKALVEGLLVVQHKYAKAANELNSRIAEVDFTRLGDVSILVTFEQRAYSRAELAAFRSLIAERTALEQAVNAEVDKYLASRSAPPARRDAALEAVRPLRAQAQQALDNLTDADLAMADAFTETLNWADAQAGALSFVGGKLVFTKAGQQEELVALSKKLAEAEQRNGEARLEMNAFQASRREAAKKGRQKIGA